MEDSTIKAVAAIGGIVILEIIALNHGINGVIFGGVVAVIAGIAGYQVARRTVVKNDS